MDDKGNSASNLSNIAANMNNQADKMNSNQNDNGQQERPMTKDERNIKNNTENLRNAADVAIATKNPYAMAAGAAVKVADKVTGGKSTEMLGKELNKANKRLPGGRKVQKKLNKVNESGLGDKIGTAARMKNQFGGGAGGAAGAAGGASQMGGAAGAASKAGAAGGASKIGGAQGNTPKSGGNTPQGPTGGGSGGGSKPPSSGGGKLGGQGNKGDNGKGGSKDDPSKEGTRVFDGIKSLWSNLPLTTKVYICLGLGILVLIIIVASFFIGVGQTFTLDYSNDVKTSGVRVEYQKYWAEICGEGAECTEEEKRQQEELLKSQQAFYDKFDSLSKKYNLNIEQKYMVLSTIFLNHDVREFSQENGSFDLDDSNEIDYTVDTNVYKREQDSLKELVKQFQITAPYCQGYYYNENNEKVTTEHGIFDSNNKIYSFGYFDKFLMSIGAKSYPEGYEDAVKDCETNENGTVILVETTNSKESIEAYYNYLKESTWLDDRPAVKELFESFAKDNNLDIDMSTWTEEQKVAAREWIIDDLKGMIKGYMESQDQDGLLYSASNGRSYWWPIGSLDTTEENGVLFAAGDPEYVGINSPFGTRVHPITHEVHTHSGIDLQGRMNATNIIASLGGTVTKVVNECASSNSYGCGGSYGNYVVVQDIKGNINIYAHMYRDSITVAVGDTVMQGQVLGKVGSSGNSTGAHLHFTIKVNGVAVDPREYIDPENPRPAASTVDFHNTSFSKEEYIAKLKSYYSKITCNKSGCNSFKNEILNNDGAEIIYDIATSRNLNPELVVARSILEGYSPGSNYNYFGYRCYNDGGLAACQKFTSFTSAIETYHKNIGQYDSMEAMLSRYAYIGKYWYTGKHWDWGGCAYAPYIYPDGIPDRVKSACAHPDGYCAVGKTSNCDMTTQEDQEAYTRWQVSKMADTIAMVFN